MFLFGVVLLLGRRRRALRTLIRKAPDRQESQNKSHPSQKFAPDRQKGSDKIRETTRFFGSALCFCWVGGVLAPKRPPTWGGTWGEPSGEPSVAWGSGFCVACLFLFAFLFVFGRFLRACWANTASSRANLAPRWFNLTPTTDQHS